MTDYIHYIAIMKQAYDDNYAFHVAVTSNNEYHRKLTPFRKEVSRLKPFPFGSHVLHTDDPSWKSVQAMDCYFDGVEEMTDGAEFIDRVIKTTTVTAQDIASYFASTAKGVALENLVYLAYVIYLKQFNDQLFPEPIEVWNGSPIISGLIRNGKLDSLPAEATLQHKLFLTEHAFDIQGVLREVKQRYGGMSEHELLTITKLNDVAGTTTSSGVTSPLRDADILALAL